jgi:hypothetical protein
MSTNITVLSNRVQPDVIGCPRPVVDNAVIDAIIKFYEDSYIIEQGFSHDVVEADIDDTDNDSVDVDIVTDGGVSATLRPAVLTEFRIDGVPWNTEYLDLLNDLNDDDFSAIAGQDKILFTYPDLTTIKFFGIDARDQRFYIKQAYVPLTTITTMDDNIYERFHKAIEARAKWELMSMQEKDWSNALQAVQNMGLYKDGVAEAKTLKSHNYTKSNKRVASQRFF